MTFTAWMALVGVLLLAMALSSAWVQRLPVSTAAIYLAVGIGIGPWGLHLIRLDAIIQAPLLLRVTEIAVVLSLFIGGLRLRLPLSDRAWRASFRLASLVMLGSIALLALLGAALWYGIGLWNAVETEPLPAGLYVALVLGVVFSLIVGCGLMALVFYSSRHGYDERGGSNNRRPDQ